jgi:hypothetical protein
MAGLAHVAMASEVLQQLDLAQRTLGKDLLAEDIGNFLDGDSLVGLVVDGRAVDSELDVSNASRCLLSGMEGQGTRRA